MNIVHVLRTLLIPEITKTKRYLSFENKVIDLHPAHLKIVYQIVRSRLRIEVIATRSGSKLEPSTRSVGMVVGSFSIKARTPTFRLALDPEVFRMPLAAFMTIASLDVLAAEVTVLKNAAGEGESKIRIYSQKNLEFGYGEKRSVGGLSRYGFEATL